MCRIPFFVEGLSKEANSVRESFFKFWAIHDIYQINLRFFFFLCPIYEFYRIVQIFSSFISCTGKRDQVIHLLEMKVFPFYFQQMLKPSIIIRFVTNCSSFCVALLLYFCLLLRNCNLIIYRFLLNKFCVNHSKILKKGKRGNSGGDMLWFCVM
jgi:hypothetical protein